MLCKSICCGNQLNGFYMRSTLALNGLSWNSLREIQNFDQIYDHDGDTGTQA